MLWQLSGCYFCADQQTLLVLPVWALFVKKCIVPEGCLGLILQLDYSYCWCAVRFYDDIVYDREYNGLVLDDDEGQLALNLPAYQAFCPLFLPNCILTLLQ